MLIVIGAHFVVADLNAWAKPLIDEAQHHKLPQQLLAKLGYSEAITSQFISHSGRAAAEAVLLELLEGCVGFRLGRARVAAPRHILRDDHLIDQSLGGFALGVRVDSRRLAIQEFGHAQIPLNIAELDDALVYDHGDAIDNRRAG